MILKINETNKKFFLVIFLIFFIISIQKISANRVNHQNIEIQPLATNSPNTPNFGPPTNINIGTNPFSVSKGDFNNDGITDLVTPNFNANNISIFLGNSSGTFNTPTNLPTGVGPRQVTIGDFNNDGLEDLVVVNRNSAFVSFFLASASSPGTFTDPTNIITNAAGISIDSADFNLDGNRDLVIATVAGSVSVFMGNGLGGFSLTPTIFTPLAQPNFVIFADVNNDLKLDIVTSSRSGNVSALLGNGTGGLIGPAVNTLTGLDSATVTAGDLNQDGKTDLVTANLTNASSSILIGDGTGNFTVTNITTGANPTQVAIADLNLDGKQDLAITNSIPNTVSVFAGNGNGTFAAAVNFSVGTTPNSVITDDINKDGKVDLIVSNQNSNNLSILSNITSIVVAPLQFTTTNFPAGVSPFFGELADFNKDGNLDIVVANSDSSSVVNSISILLGTSTGFGTATSFPVAGSAINGVTAGDFNKDGNLDVAVAARFSNNVAVLFGDGTGSFGASTSFFSGAGPREISSADLNKDGNLDLVVPNIFDNTISVLINNSMGSFAFPLTFPTETNPNFVAINDLNKDGNLDLVASNENSSSISVVLGDGTGNFGTTSNFTVGTTPGHVILEDINNDGNVDAITANFSGTVSVLLGNGLGSFASAIDFPAGSSPGASALTDINNDGKLDLLVPNQLTSTVTILLGDGLGNFTSTTSVSVGTGPLEVFAADFNFDGCVDFITANVGGGNITLALQAGCPSISILPATLPNPILNNNYSQQLTATPIGSYSFAIISGNLPVGLSLSRTGLISGIAATQGTFTFTVQAVDNNQCTGMRTYTLTVGANTGAGRIGFSVNSFTVTEGSIATITVVRTNGGVGTVSVNYSTINGTARSGVDYVNSSGTITFGNGDMSPKTFTVQTLSDDVSESNKTILLSLGNPTGGAELNLTTATLNVIERDAPRPGRLAFSQTAYSVNETGGAATINVSRLDGSNVAVSVNFATSAGANARAGSNYMETSGTLTFAPGVVSQSFNIPIFNDRQPGQDKIVNLRLSNATNGAIISGGTATLTIIESTPPVPPAVLQTVNRVEFDSVNIGDMATRTITIRNVGGQDLTFNNPDVSGNDITLLTPPRTNRLAANESTSFEVQFSPKPSSLGDITGNITISSNGGVARIPVTARSIDIIAPSVKFTAPMGGELLTAGGQLRIRYEAEDNDALNDFTVSFVATPNNASKSISPNATGASSGDIGRLDSTFREVIWNIPGNLSSSTVRIIIRAKDRAGNIVNVGSGQFSVQRPSTPAPVLQTIVRFTPVPDGVIAPPMNVTADATEIKDEIVTRPPDPVLLVNITFDPPPVNQLLPPQNVKVKAGELTTNGINQIANINRRIMPKAEGDLVLAGFNVYRVPQPEDGTMPDVNLIVDPENLVATLPADAMGFMDMVPTGESNNFSYSVTSFFGNGQMSGGSQPTGTDLPVIKNPIFTTGTVFLQSAGSFIKPGAMLIINDTDTFTLQFNSEATQFTVPKRQRSNGRNLTIKRIITKTAIVKLIVKNPDGNTSVGVMFNRKGIVQSSKVNKDKVPERQINPQVDTPMLVGYNIYRTLQPTDGRMLSPEEIIKPENLVGSIPGNMNSFTDTPSTGQGGNFTYSVTSFFGNGQMSGGSQPANTDLPIIKSPRFDGKLFFIDAAGSFIKAGATLIINDTESYTLEFDSEATRFTTNTRRGNPSNLTIDKFIKKGDTVRLIVRNSDGKVSVGVTFTR